MSRSLVAGRCRGGISLVEAIFTMMILSLALAGSYRAFSRFTTRTSQTLTKRLVLEMEARKAILHLFQGVTQGVEVIMPAPGVTLPYLIYRDPHSNVHWLYLVEDPIRSKEEDRPMSMLYHMTRDPSGAIPDKVVPILKYVRSIRFTSHNFGNVLIACELLYGQGTFSLVNQVRLQNEGVVDP